MSPVQIDWTDYLRVHSDRRNLIIHVIAVPLFVGSFVYIPVFLFRSDYVSVAISMVLALLAMVLQGRGHAKEREAPLPFGGPCNFLRRWFREQFVIFPLFVVSGKWWHQYQAATENPEHDS